MPNDVADSAPIRSRAVAMRCSGGVLRQSSKLSRESTVRSKLAIATSAAGQASSTRSTASFAALDHIPPRDMLALVPMRTTTRRVVDGNDFSAASGFKNGRAKAMASTSSAAARRSSKSQCSIRLLRVSRGGVGLRNIKDQSRSLPGRPPHQVKQNRPEDGQPAGEKKRCEKAVSALRWSASAGRPEPDAAEMAPWTARRERRPLFPIGCLQSRAAAGSTSASEVKVGTLQSDGRAFQSHRAIQPSSSPLRKRPAASIG